MNAWPFASALYTRVFFWKAITKKKAPEKSPGLDCCGSQTESEANYFFAAAASFIEAALSAYFLVKRSTRPAVSTNFCLPVKNG